MEGKVKTLAGWAMILSLGIFAPSAEIRAEGVPQARDFEVPGHGALRLAIPATWKVEVRPLREPASITLHVTLETARSFDIQLTAVLLDAKKLGKTTPDSIRANMQKAAKELLPRAVEKAATLKELRGGETVGWYYAMTDRSPAPGEFRYLTQGSFVTGEVLCAFTVLHDAPDTAEVGQALRLFADAVHAK